MKPVGNKIIVFSKAPIAGEVKTRMIPKLGAAGASELHHRLLQHTLQMCHQADIATIDLYCSPNTEHPIFQQLQQQYALNLHPQQGENLGQRMYHAMAMALQTSSRIILIGSDCPWLTAEHLQTAFDALNSPIQLAIAPAVDGGYVLIAANAICPEIFQNIQWSTSRVYPQTQDAIKHIGWQYNELTTLYDLDTADDLKQLNRQQQQQFLADIPLPTEA